MNLIQVSTNESNEQVVSGRDLHSFLEVGTEYAKWFERMAGYGFDENIDYVVIVKNDENPRVGRPSLDHAMKIDMAKEISMIQRSEKGKQARRYFIEIEKQFNQHNSQRLPGTYKEALLLLAEQVGQNEQLLLQNKVKDQQISELQPKATYYDLVLQNKSLLATTTIAKDYGMGAQTLNKILHDLGIQYKQSGIWLLYAKYQNKGYTQTTTHVVGAGKTTIHTKWTQKGRLFLYDLLKGEIDMLPVIERNGGAA